MTNPIFESMDSVPVTTRRVLPIYPLTAGLSNSVMLRCVQQALAICDPPEEILPEAIRQEYGILPADRAYAVIHQPASLQEAELAKKRLIFEEFFVFSAGLALMRSARAGKTVTPYRHTDLKDFYAALPFRLTGAQNRAIDEILADLCSILQPTILEGCRIRCNYEFLDGDHVISYHKTLPYSTITETGRATPIAYAI